MADPAINNPLPADISFIRGGPFYRVQEQLHLVERDRWNLTRRIILTVSVAWIPLILLTLFFHPSQLHTVLTDYRIYARFLIAIPLMVAGQAFTESRLLLIIRGLWTPNLLTHKGAAQLEQALTSARRLRDSFLAEFILATAVVTFILSTLPSRIERAGPWAVYADAGGTHFSAAGWYSLLVSTVIFQFLIAVALWKWLIWAYFLFKLSRADLKLMATHPDRRAGLGFLGFSPQGFVPIALALSFTLGATWRFQLIHENEGLFALKLPIAVFAVLIAVLAFGPLLLFAPRLARLRRKAIIEYGDLGQMQTVAFNRKWILHRKGREEEFQSTPDVSALIDYGSSFGTILDMKPIPLDRTAISALVVAVVVPLLPAVAAKMPLTEAFKTLLEILR